jgi:Na+/melibiose symporter-like transporter
MSNPANRLPISSMLTYASGMLGYAALLRLVSSWLIKHLRPPDDGLAVISVVTFGAVMIIGRVYIDAITDPVIGYWSDHLRSKWGRRKPFILAGAVPTIVATVGLFVLYPGMDEVLASVLYAVFVTMFFVGSTLMAMAYLALLPEITPNPQDRKLISIFLAVAVVLGTALGQVLPGNPPFVIPGTTALFSSALMLAALGALTLGMVVFVFREPPWSRYYGLPPRLRPPDEPDPVDPVVGADAAHVTDVKQRFADGRPDDPPAAVSGLAVGAGGEYPLEHVESNTPSAPNYRGITVGEGFWMLWVAMTYAPFAVLRTALFPITVWFGWRMIPRTPRGPMRDLAHSLKTMMRFKPFVGFAGAFIAMHAAFAILTPALLYVPQALLGYNDAESFVRVVTRELPVHEAGRGGVEVFIAGSEDQAAELTAEGRGYLVMEADESAGLPRLSPDAVVPHWKAALIAQVERLNAEPAELDRIRAWPDDMISPGLLRDSAQFRLEGGAVKEALIDAGVISAADGKAVLRFLDERANLTVSFFLALTLGSTLIIGVPLIYLLLGWIGKKRTANLCLVVFIALPALMPIVGMDVSRVMGFAIIYLMCVGVGISLAGIFVGDQLFLADLVSLDTKITGARRESLFFGIYYLLMKIGIGAVGIGISTVLFELFGFSYSTPLGVMLCGPAVAIITLAGGIAFWKWYPSDVQFDALNEAADKKLLDAEAVKDPIKSLESSTRLRRVVPPAGG